MNIRDVIRSVLDILDKHEEHDKDMYDDGVHADVNVHQNDEETSHFKQILAMLDADSFGPLANSPNEVVAPVSAVTTDAGGGPNAPKHPHDIRVKDPSAYPDQQEY